MGKKKWWKKDTLELSALRSVRLDAPQRVLDLADILQADEAGPFVVRDAQNRPLSLVDRNSLMPLNMLRAPQREMLKSLPPLVVTTEDYPFEEDSWIRVAALLAQTGGGILIGEVGETAKVLPTESLFTKLGLERQFPTSFLNLVWGGLPGDIHDTPLPLYICKLCVPNVIKVRPVGSGVPTCDNGHLMIPYS